MPHLHLPSNGSPTLRPVVAAAIGGGVLALTCVTSAWVAVAGGWHRVAAVAVAALVQGGCARFVRDRARPRSPEATFVVLTFGLATVASSFVIALVAVALALNSGLYDATRSDLLWGAVPLAALALTMGAIGVRAATGVAWVRLLQRVDRTPTLQPRDDD